MPEYTFELKTSTLGILSDDQRTMVTIPANALVTIVAGDIDADGFLQVWYRGKLLILFAEDLRVRGKRVWGQSTSA